MKLTLQQVRFFRESGYLRLSSRLPDERVRHLKAVVESCIAKAKQPYATNEKGQIIRLNRLITRNQVFMETFCSALILEPLESLLGPNIELVLNRHNYATLTLKDAAPSRLHRDVLQWSRSVVTALIFLEQATVETGCTRIVPGSHLLPFVGTPNNGGTWMDEHSIFADLLDQALPVPMPAGGILLFDSLVFHSAGTNTAGGTRMAIASAYHSVDELSSEQNSAHRVLVRGERIYRGNDRQIDAGGE